MKTETKPFDPTKPYRTRDGREAKIVHTFKDGGLLTVVDDEIHTNLPSGYYITATQPSPYDLVNIPEKKTIEFWVNVYEKGVGENYETKTDADERVAKYRIACLHFTREYEEGEGL